MLAANYTRLWGKVKFDNQSVLSTIVGILRAALGLAHSGPSSFLSWTTMNLGTHVALGALCGRIIPLSQPSSLLPGYLLTPEALGNPRMEV